MVPPPSSPPPTPPPPAPRAGNEASGTPRRLPGPEDFPETGPNALATVSQRAWGRIIDELVMTVPMTVVLVVVRAADTEAAESLTQEVELPITALAGLFVVRLVYEIVAVALWGQTVGKWFSGIRVARYTDGGRPHWDQSTLRCLLWGAPAAAGLMLARTTVIGALPVFASCWRNELRRGWHDDAGGTIVVRTR
jgi:uncharacterized RDD family membrane protein YckC